MTAENYEMAVDLDAGADEMVTDDAVDETDRVKSNATKRKGRGFAQSGGYTRKDAIGTYETVEDEVQGTAQRSIEGWIILITGVHEEATEEDVMERVAEYGEIRNMHLNLDRRTGYVKGYALVEYSTYPEAKAAVDGLNGSTLLEQAIHADFAFVRGASFSALERVRGARRNPRR
ncbi:RNA-binding protein 8A [Gaertneriomyces sp. JEL0708]|nr:RNA-binding protein 8A [Gaertneriomyces sp. JEL0708]